MRTLSILLILFMMGCSSSRKVKSSHGYIWKHQQQGIKNQTPYVSKRNKGWSF